MAKNTAKKTTAAAKPAEVKAAPAAEAAKVSAPAQAAKPVEKAPAKEVKAPAKEVKAPAKETKKTSAKTAKAAKTPAAKTPAAKSAEPKKPGRKPGRKPKPLALGDVCEKLYKKIDMTKAGAVSDLVAADVEIWGWEDGTNKHIFVEVVDGKVRVEPFDYLDCTLKVYISYADAKAFLDGKLTLNEALVSGKLNAIGNVAHAVKLAGIF